jgi:DNA-directed RNA polymerase subunit beta
MISKGVKFNRKNINEGCSREELLQGRKQLRRSEEVTCFKDWKAGRLDARVNGLRWSWCVTTRRNTITAKFVSASP